MSDADIFTDEPAPAGALFTDEPAPKSLGDFAGNVVSGLGRNLNPINIGKGLAETAKQGLYDIPKAAAESSIDLVKGAAKAATGGGLPSVEDVRESPLIKKTEEMTEPIAKDPLEYAYKNPVETAMLGAAAAGIAEPFMGGAAGAPAAARVASVAPEAAAAETPLVEIPKAAARTGLPVIEPGAKTGQPHALFAYNDDFGPGGAKRSLYNVFGDPEHPAIKGAGGHGSSVPQETLEKAGIPVTGREPRSVGKWEPIEEPQRTPPPPKTEAPAAAKDPLQDVKDYIKGKYGETAAKPGFPEKAARYLQEEARKAGGKDIGLQGLQVRQMGEGFKGVEKAEQLIDYAREKGYLKPGLTDIGRKELVKTNLENAGKNVGAIRGLADQRAKPPLDQFYAELKKQLTDKYAIKAPAEVKKTLAVVQKDMKANPTFSGVAEISTDLNKELRNLRSMGRHVGPNTDAADILSRMNNDAIRATLKPEESQLYTDSLRDFGAHKKLEKVIAGADRKGLTGRGAPGSITNRLMQSLLDRGGYRVAGNVADRMAKSVLKNPGNFKTLPDFFEQLVHQSENVVDESLEHPGMFKGGRVPDDVRSYVGSHGC